MANPVRELARWLRNGKDPESVASPLDAGPDTLVDSEGEAEAERPSVLVLDKNSVLAEIWDNEEDAIYDDL